MGWAVAFCDVILHSDDVIFGKRGREGAGDGRHRPWGHGTHTLDSGVARVGDRKVEIGKRRPFSWPWRAGGHRGGERHRQGGPCRPANQKGLDQQRRICLGYIKRCPRADVVSRVAGPEAFGPPGRDRKRSSTA